MTAAAAIDRLLAVMARLRDPQSGCPWDVQQDFATIAPYTIEEAYEVADAIDRGDLPGLKDELGDLLLQVVFHAQMARERLEDELGDLLFVCANLARHAKVDVGNALRRANLKFERRFRAMEAMAAEEGVALSSLPLDAQDAYWNRAKAQE